MELFALIASILALLAFGGIISYVVRKRGKRFVATPHEKLVPASTTGGDIAYRYYLDETGLRRLAADLRVDLPVKHRVVESDEIGAALPQGPSARTSHEVTKDLAPEINLAAFARRLRKLGPRYVVDGLALVPVIPDCPRPSDWDREDLRSAKQDQFRSAGKSNQLVVIRGHFAHMPLSDTDTSTPITLRLTHLSNEVLQPETYPGTGDAAATVFPEGLSLQVVLPNRERLEEGVQERFLRGEPFFGEVLAHSASYGEASSVFSCTAWAVWGCPSPQNDDDDEIGVAY
jgi:hypothetical protein